MQNPPPCAPESDHARGRAQPSVAQEKQRCSSCQKTRCRIQDCPVRSLTTSTTPQKQERQARENLANIIRNIKAMPTEGRLGMVAELLKEEPIAPARIRVRQVGSIKPTIKEQARKRLWQHSAEERKEIGLLFRQEAETQGTATPVQIHTLQIAKQPGKLSKGRIRVVKTKPITKARIIKDVLQHSRQQQKEIALEALKGIPMERLMPVLRKLRLSAKPVVMGNLTVKNANFTNLDNRTKDFATRIRTISTANLTLGCRVVKGYAKLAAKVAEREERKIDAELVRKAQDSQRIKWDHRTVTQQLTKLKKLAKKDPELGQQKLKTYKLERQEAARNDDRLQNSRVTIEPSNPLKDQEPNALYIPMHARTKLGTHILPALVDTGATQNFLSHDAAKRLGLTWKENDMPKSVTNADGSRCGTGIITLYCDIPMKLNNLWKEERFYRAETGTDQVVLGIPWLANFRPMINWTKGTVDEVLEVPLHTSTRKVKKKVSWADEPAEPATCSIKEEEPNSQIKRNREKEDAPWSGDHCPSQRIRPGGDQDVQSNDALGDKNTPSELTTLQTNLKVKKAQCNDPIERDLIQDYLEDLHHLTNGQQPPGITQEIEPEQTRNNAGNADKQILRSQIEEPNSINNGLCKAQGIEEIPERQNEAKQVPLPLEVPKTNEDAARMLGLFKPTIKDATEPKERHKKGIKVLTNGINNASTPQENRPKLLPELEYLEDLEDEDLISEPEGMIVENHGLKRGQEAQRDTKDTQNRLVQRGAKHGLSDPCAQENKHLVQKEVQGLEHMVVEDHGPKKGMAPRLKPQFNPLFFPFATCLPNISTLSNHKTEWRMTPEADSQTSPMGRESNEKQIKFELTNHKRSVVNTTSINPIPSELTSPWPDQWQLRGLDSDITNQEDPWPDPEGTNVWNNALDTEELDLTNDTSNETPWELFGEPHWVTEFDDAIEPEPEEDPFPPTLQHPDEEGGTTIIEQNNQCDKEILEQRNLENKLQGSASDDEEGTTDTSHPLTQQKLTRPTSDEEEGTTVMEQTRLEARVPSWNKKDPATNDAIRGKDPQRISKPISHQNMTRQWMTQSRNVMHQPEWEKAMESLLQTSAHYPKTSNQNNRSTNDRCFGTLSASPIQEHTQRSLSTMTQGADADRSRTPPSNNQRSRKQAMPLNDGQEATAIAVLGMIILTTLTMARVIRNQGLNRIGDPTLNKAENDQAKMEPKPHTTQRTECPSGEHWTLEGSKYKNPPGKTTCSPSKPTNSPPTPSTPNNSPVTSPCPPPLPIPLLQLRSEDSGNKARSTTTLGRATTNSIHGGATTTAAIPGTVPRQWVATRIMLRTKTTIAILGTPVRRWEAAKAVLPMNLRTQHTPSTMMPMTRMTNSELGHIPRQHGMFPVAKNMPSLTTSSPISSANDSPTTLHSECLGNVSPSMTSHASVSTYAWTALHSVSQEKSKPPISITRTWKSYSTTWNGTCVQKVSSTHSMKAAALQSPILLSTNKGPRSLGPYPANGNDDLNASGQQQWPSTYASEKRPPPSTCSSSKTTGSPPLRFTTYKGDSTSHNRRNPSGGKYSDKTTLYTIRSLTLKDTRTRTRGSTLDMWKHPPKKGMNVASGHHFSILSLSLASHHLTRAPDLVLHDWGARDRSHDPVTDSPILTIDFSCDQACDLSHDTM